MFIEVTPREAARLFARGIHVWDWPDPRLAGTFELEGVPRSWKKARKLRALTRKLAGPWNVGGWYVYKKEG